MGSFFAKLFEKLLELQGRRLVEDGTFDICVEQGGFMPRRTTYDSIFILESLREAQIQYRRKMYTVFIDLRKAFDTVGHRRFLELARKQGAPAEWIRQLQGR
jgi:hypothetical protein